MKFADSYNLKLGVLFQSKTFKCGIILLLSVNFKYGLTKDAPTTKPVALPASSNQTNSHAGNSTTKDLAITSSNTTVSPGKNGTAGNSSVAGEIKGKNGTTKKPLDAGGIKGFSPTTELYFYISSFDDYLLESVTEEIPDEVYANQFETDYSGEEEEIAKFRKAENSTVNQQNSTTAENSTVQSQNSTTGKEENSTATVKQQAHTTVKPEKKETSTEKQEKPKKDKKSTQKPGMPHKEKEDKEPKSEIKTDRDDDDKRTGGVSSEVKQTGASSAYSREMEWHLLICLFILCEVCYEFFRAL